MTFYAHFEDFVEGYVGPFATQGECDAHAAFCKQRGDGATYHGAVEATAVPADAFTLSPEQDKEFTA